MSPRIADQLFVSYQHLVLFDSFSKKSNERTFTTDEVASVIGVDRATLLRWVRRGFVAEVACTPTGDRVWRLDDLCRVVAFWQKIEERRNQHTRSV